MSLSKQERQAWNELERVLADELPPMSMGIRTGTPEQSPRDSPPLVRSISFLVMVLMTGFWLLIIGTLAPLLPMALTGLIMVCFAVDGLRRPTRRRARREGLDQ